MKIRVIGCGNAFSFLNFNVSFVLEEGEHKLLIDCGGRTPLALASAGITLSEIGTIYISHAHADHIGGLEEFGFTRYDWMRHPRAWDDYKHNGTADRDYMDPKVGYVAYAPRLIANDNLMKELWDFSMKGGLRSMEGFDSTIETFFEPVSVTANVPFFWPDKDGWRFDLIQQIHIMAGSTIMPTYGLVVSRKGHQTVYFTTDSQHCSPKQIEIFYKNSDLIFQDCECTGVDTKSREFRFSSGVHASYAQLAGWPSANSTKLSAEIKAKMILTHYQDFVSKMKDSYGNACDWYALAREDGFRGFAGLRDVHEV